MDGFQSHYNAALHLERFEAECRPGQSSGQHFTLNMGPLTLFATEGQLRQVSQAIDAALLEAERRRVSNPHYIPTVQEAARHPQEFVDGMEEVGRPWTVEEILAREG